MAYGTKWKYWFRQQVCTTPTVIPVFPRQHRDHVLIQFEAATARYHLHDGVADILKQLNS
eukprot:4859127-Prymnesium_polylepis.1